MINQTNKLINQKLSISQPGLSGWETIFQSYIIYLNNADKLITRRKTEMEDSIKADPELLVEKIKQLQRQNNQQRLELSLKISKIKNLEKFKNFDDKQTIISGQNNKNFVCLEEVLKILEN